MPLPPVPGRTPLTQPAPQPAPLSQTPRAFPTHGGHATTRNSPLPLAAAGTTRRSRSAQPHSPPEALLPPPRQSARVRPERALCASQSPPRARRSGWAPSAGPVETPDPPPESLSCHEAHCPPAPPDPGASALVFGSLPPPCLHHDPPSSSSRWCGALLLLKSCFLF